MSFDVLACGLSGQVRACARDKIAFNDDRANLFVQKALADLALDRLDDTRSIQVPRKDDSPAVHHISGEAATFATRHFRSYRAVRPG